MKKFIIPSLIAITLSGCSFNVELNGQKPPLDDVVVNTQESLTTTTESNTVPAADTSANLTTQESQNKYFPI